MDDGEVDRKTRIRAAFIAGCLAGALAAILSLVMNAIHAVIVAGVVVGLGGCAFVRIVLRWPMHNHEDDHWSAGDTFRNGGQCHLLG
jgi:hypothetical protein